MSVINLEVDLRNQGVIINGKLRTNSEQKPYLLKQMNEFKKWAEKFKELKLLPDEV